MVAQYDRTVSTPRREFKAISVIDRTTGKIIKIKDFRFNPAIHERLNDDDTTSEAVVATTNSTGELTTTSTDAPVPNDHPDINYDEAGDPIKPWLHRPTGKRFKTLSVIKRFIRYGF